MATIKTTVGRATVPWRGKPDAHRGPCHIEWTIDTETIWGLNTTPVDEVGSAILQEGHNVILRGTLRVSANDPEGVLVLDGAIVLLGLDGLAPLEADGSWIRIEVDRRDLHLYPYDLF